MSALKFAIPSKGRLKEQSEAYFSGAGIHIQQVGGSRGYAARIKGMSEVDVQLRSASEIAAGLMDGEFNLGVTGLDLLHELASDPTKNVHLVGKLGFGFANLVVAVPNAWLDVQTMADLDDVAAELEERTGRRMRVATKYLRQTRDYFDEMGVGHYKIVESAGATEGAPASGVADIVVDITTTGATLAGNGLKILSDGVIRKSEAYLVAGLGASWSNEAREALRTLIKMQDARAEGKDSVCLTYAPDFEPGFLGSEYGEGAFLVRAGEVICRADVAREIAQKIADESGGPVASGGVDSIYRKESARFEAFEADLARYSRD